MGLPGGWDTLTPEQKAIHHHRALVGTYRRGINGLIDKLAVRMRYASPEQRERIRDLLETAPDAGVFTPATGGDAA